MTDDALFRLGVSVTLFAVLAGWEWRLPRRESSYPPIPRWRRNLGLGLINLVMLRIIAPAGLIGVALWAEARDYGVLRWFSGDLPMTWPAEIIALDLAIYWQHRLLHRVPALWRLHRTHHLDPHLDVTSGFRFHPSEIGASWLFKAGVIVALGASPTGVLVFEVLLNAFALFTHANVRLRWDHWLRRLIVTPDMHRVHHSVDIHEQNSNYGNTLSIWDRVFGSYRDQPAAGHQQMKLGVAGRSASEGFARLLGDPVVR